MKLANTLILTILTATGVAHAEANTSVEPYDLKNRSSFGAAAESRAPFWPIGWTRPKQGAPEPENRVAAPKVEAPKFQLSPDAFNVTSVLLGRPSIAVINGRSFQVGEPLPVIAGNERLRVRLTGIDEQGVKLQLDQQPAIFVPMRRNILQKRDTPAASREEWSIKITKQ
jgi:hypothetical protein